MLAAIYLVTAGVFALDVAIPLGHGIWILYLFPLWLSSRLILPAAPLRFASVCTVLLAGGLWLAPPGVDVTTVMFNRALGTVMIWGAAYLLSQRREAEAALVYIRREEFEAEKP